MNEDTLTHLSLYGDNTLMDNTNTFLLNYVIEYINQQNVLMILCFCDKKIIPRGDS